MTVVSTRLHIMRKGYRRLKRKLLSISLFFILLPFVLVGCTSQLGAGELIEKAIVASEKLDSYQFDGKVELKVDSDSDEDAIAQMFDTIRLDLDGVYQREPLQAELNANVGLGQLGFGLEIPLVLAENKLWVQVPALPIPQMSPDIVGKYIEVDLEELQDDPMMEEVGIESLDLETQQKLGMELIRIFTKHYDEDEYFQVMDTEEAELPEKIEAEHVVRFSLTEDNLEEAVSTFIHGVLPDVHELLSDEQWSETLGVSEEDLDELEELIEEAKENEDELLEELTETANLQKIELDLALNKENHINYQKLSFVLSVQDDDGSWSSVSMLFENHLTNINEKQQFEHGIPEDEDTVSYEQLLPMFIGPSF